MKKLIKLSILLIIPVLYHFTAFAESMTIGEVIKTALEQNLQLQSEKSEEEYQSYISKSVRGKYLPVLKVSASALLWDEENKTKMDLPVLDAVIQEIVPTLSPDSRQRIQNAVNESDSSGITVHDQHAYKISATIVQPVLSLYGIYNLHNASLKMKKAAEYDTLKIKRELQKDIAKVYFRMLSAIENEKSFDAAIDQIEKTYPVIEALIDEGRVEPNALLKLKMQRSDFEKGKISASIAVMNSKLILNMIMNRDLDSPLEPVWNGEYFKTFTQKITENDNAENTVDFLNNIPEIKSTEERINALKSNRHAAVSSFLPELNLVLNYDFQEGFGDMQPQNQFYAGILFSWNIWEWGSGFYKIKAAQTQTAKTQLNLALLKSGKTVEIRQLQNSLKKALTEIETGEVQVEYAKENLKIEEELFKAGNSTTTELLQAQTSLVKAENDLNIKQAELCSFYIEFILSTGRDFKDLEI